MYYTILYYNYTILYYTILYYTILYYTILYYTIQNETKYNITREGAGQGGCRKTCRMGIRYAVHHTAAADEALRALLPRHRA
eukprot:g59132.t1